MSITSTATRDMVNASYPIGPDGSARFSVRFGWFSDHGDVAPQAEILLQIAVDVLTTNLRRLHSELAPVVEEPSEPELIVALEERHSSY